MPRKAATPITPLERQLAAVIRGELAKQQATNAQLADQLGVSRNTLSRMLNAHIHMNVNQLDEIATFLGVRLADVWAEAEALAKNADNDRRTQSAAELRDRLDESGRPNSRSTPDERPNEA